MSADNDTDIEVTSNDDAQAMLSNVEGDLADADDFIDDTDYIQAMDMVDSAIEKLNQVRKYLEGIIE